MTHHTLAADFLVVGGGLAGVCAAVAAARNGAKVILVQDRSVLGGNASSEVKMHVVGADCHGFRPGARESGIIEELKLEDAVRNPHRSYAQWDLLLYEKVVTEPNITLLLDTDCVGCNVDGSGGRRRITDVQAVRNSTEDRFTITAHFFADCSGDGRLALEAGADFVVGRESKSQYGEKFAVDVADRNTLGSSILFTARQYDTPQPFVSPSWVRKFQKRNFMHRPIKSYEYGYWWFEWGGHLDTLKDNALIRHELLRITLGIWDYVKNSGEHPDSANWALEWVGALPGKRESRRFLGTHVLTELDITSGRLFADQVAYGGWWLDLHPPMGVDATDQPPCEQHNFPHLYTIPLSCIYSRNVENLFVGGRMISATHVAFASTRVMATCSVVGQAIGTAAAIASANCRQAELEHLAVDEQNEVTAGQLFGGAVNPLSGPARVGKRSGGSVTQEAQVVNSPGRSEPGTYGNHFRQLHWGIAEVFQPAVLTKLQQQLLKDDVFLPGLSNQDAADLARRAVITSSGEMASGQASYVVDGITRELLPHLGPWADGKTHRWESTGLPAALDLSWNEPQQIREIHLTFDSGFHRELILSASDSTTERTIRGPQPELVREYDIYLDQEIAVTVGNNYLRKCVHRLPRPVVASELRLAIKSTHGISEARVFEVRVYS